MARTGNTLANAYFEAKLTPLPKPRAFITLRGAYACVWGAATGGLCCAVLCCAVLCCVVGESRGVLPPLLPPASWSEPYTHCLLCRPQLLNTPRLACRRGGLPAAQVLRQGVCLWSVAPRTAGRWPRDCPHPGRLHASRPRCGAALRTGRRRGRCRGLRRGSGREGAAGGCGCRRGRGCCLCGQPHGFRPGALLGRSSRGSGRGQHRQCLCAGCDGPAEEPGGSVLHSRRKRLSVTGCGARPHACPPAFAALAVGDCARVVR
jgi:hypothetical protein